MLKRSRRRMRSTRVTVGTTSVQVLGSDPQRVALIINPPATNRVTISDSIGDLDLAGIVIFSQQAPFLIRYEDFGDALQSVLYGRVNTGSATVGFCEILDLDFGPESHRYRRYE